MNVRFTKRRSGAPNSQTRKSFQRSLSKRIVYIGCERVAVREKEDLESKFDTDRFSSSRSRELRIREVAYATETDRSIQMSKIIPHKRTSGSFPYR